jgi:hypothetical protein
MLDLHRLPATHPGARLTVRAQPGEAQLAGKARIGTAVSERHHLVEQRRRPQVRIVDEAGRHIGDERRQRIRRRRPAHARFAFAVEIRADRLAVALEMTGDRRDRPPPLGQGISFHVFTP